MGKINKTRYWTGVLYVENMRPDWQDCIGDIVQVPYAYCVHNHDRDSKSEYRKDHVHLILVFSNTTTYQHALDVFDLLSDDGKRAINTCQAIVSIRGVYDYLIHDTESCKKQGKEQYSPDERIIGNNFDIGAYEQLGVQEKNEMFIELSNAIRDYEIMNYMDFYELVIDNFGAEYVEIIRCHSAHFERMTKGNYQRWERAQRVKHRVKSEPILVEETQENVHDCAENKESEQKNVVISPRHDNAMTTQICPICGSYEVVKNGKTPANTQVFKCKACGKRWAE